MSACSFAATTHTNSAQAAALSLNLGEFAKMLLDKFGPMLADLLIKLLLEKSRQGVLATTHTGPFEVKTFIAMMLDRFGPTLVDQFADQLAAMPDPIAGLASRIIRDCGKHVITEVVDFLNTPAGMAAINSAIGDLSMKLAEEMAAVNSEASCDGGVCDSAGTPPTGAPPADAK